MKVIIDLIEDIRESIGNAEAYVLRAGLLREDANDTSKLIYAGEAPIARYWLDEVSKTLHFEVGTEKTVKIGELIPELLILDMEKMMYMLKIDVNGEYKDIEIVGFGKSDEEQVYTLFIKL